jgi:putative transposase
MSVSRRYFAPGQLQFITSSVYRRLKLFDSDRLRLMFVEVLREYRQEAGFLLLGWVLMPEHFHFLIKPEPAESTSRLLQEVQEANRATNCFRLNRESRPCLVP